MNITPLNKSVVMAGSQEALASQLQVTQGAIQKALISKRNIFIVTDLQGSTAVEIKSAFNTEPDLGAITKMIKV